MPTQNPASTKHCIPYVKVLNDYMYLLALEFMSTEIDAGGFAVCVLIQNNTYFSVSLSVSPGTRAASAVPNAARGWSQPLWPTKMEKSTAKVCILYSCKTNVYNK